MNKHILGLDLGTNSIGWAVVEEGDSGKSIAGAGSRIIPMDAKMLGDFESGNSISQTADRTRARGMRRMYERHALRRERLNRVLNILGYLPSDYADALNTYGQIHKGEEPKLAWSKEGEFLFRDSFLEMVEDFRHAQPQLLADGKTIPYDWTIYFLRKKALTQPISGQELAWVLHQFNSKRGYNQSRSEQEETNPSERKEFISLRVEKVVNTGEEKNGRTWYEVHLENGWVYRRQSAYPLDWEGKVRDFIVTTKLNEDGTEKLDKEGNVKRSLSAPSEDDWGLRKIKTEHDIKDSHKTVGEFIYDSLLANPDQKIIGQLVRTVDRQYYKEEIRRIIVKQMEYLPELSDRHLYEEAVRALYQNNEAYRNSILSRDFAYLLIDDVLFYQRPLKSKKSLINECPYEYHTYKDDKGETQRQYLKCISKSHPLFEEFRVRQFVSNLKILYSADGIHLADASDSVMPDREELTAWLMTQKEVDEKSLLKHLAGKKVQGLTWNYASDKVYPMAPVRSMLIKALGEDATEQRLLEIWHILYSVSDKVQVERAIDHKAAQYGWDDNTVKLLKRQKAFQPEYGAYSEKAIKRLLEKMREGMSLYDAEMAVYGVRKHDAKWHTPQDIDTYLQAFRLHSLNNPVVEQVVKETLRTVRDIWKRYGTIDEIHLEMGRELKLPAAKRKQILQRNLELEKLNTEARAKIAEFLPNPSYADIKKYRLWLEQGQCSPYTGQPIALSALFSPAYEIEHVIPQSRYFDDSMTNKIVCEAEVNRLKDRLLGHAFIAQHGGEKVTLSGGKIVQVLTTEAYEDLVRQTFRGNRAKQEKLMLDDIPDGFIARQLNDSRYISNLMRGLLSNIVREQDPETGSYEPEATSKHLIVTNGNVTDRLKKDWGINDVWNHIILPRFQRLNTLLGSTEYTRFTPNGQEVPAVPTAMQAGFSKKRIDHRHHAMDAIVIACATRNHVALISNENAASSRQDVRRDLNTLLRETQTTEWNGRKHTIFGDFKKPWPTFTQDVEAVLRDIVVSFKQNLRVINKSNNRSLCFVEGKKQSVPQTQGANWAIRKPMHKETVFGQVNLQMRKTVNLKTALTMLDRIVEPDLRKTLRRLVSDGCDEKQIKKYFASDKDVWADVNLQKIEVYYYTNETNDRYYATRVAVDESFNEKTICEHVTDSGIRRILLAHLEANDGDPQRAFSPDGLERMNANITALNGGTPHKPIYKVRKYEKADRYAIGQSGVKAKKFVEAAKGSVLYCGVFANADGERKFDILTLRELVRIQESAADRHIRWQELYREERSCIMKDYTFLFMLSPGDAVVVPVNVDGVETKLYYSVNNFSGTHFYFSPINHASAIHEKEVDMRIKDDKVIGSFADKTTECQGVVIKDVCLPVQVDRLGNITQ